MGCSQGKTILQRDDLQFLVKNTSLDQCQVKVSFEKFSKKHPDGKIDRDSFREMMKICYPHSDTENLENHIFRMYDENQDGIIDFREFMLVVYIMSNGSPEQNLGQIFKLLDIDNDGCVSITEFKKVINDIYHLTSYNTQMDGIIQV